MLPIARTSHITMVILTIGFFLLRSAWAFAGSPLLRVPVVRVLPHVVDTLLLISALTTAALLQQYPFIDNWLTAKFFGLVAYIVLGHITLWRVRDNRQRFVALGATLGVFAYIVLVARSHDPLGGL
jgi:uncharacterized membrane protein SirB2